MHRKALLDTQEASFQPRFLLHSTQSSASLAPLGSAKRKPLNDNDVPSAHKNVADGRETYTDVSVTVTVTLTLGGTDAEEDALHVDGDRVPVERLRAPRPRSIA